MQDPTPEGAGGGGARPDEERRGAAAGGLASGGASWLQRLFEEVRGSSQLSMAPAEPPPLTVAAVERYLAEAPPPPAAPQYWYDVTLADGACQQRCYLAPRLNGLVQRAQLRAGARLRLRRCSYLYDEKRLRYGFLCLEELEPAGGGGGTDPPAPPRRPRHCPPPLRGEKKHYLPLWNNEDPYGDMWVVDKPQAQVDVDEISLNVRDPPTKISIIPEEMVKPDWGLPEVKYRFITRSELDDLPNNHSCDVIGLVTFVGRAERARKREHGEDFWLYRWAHAIDGTSDQPFILELFATSQPEVFEHIHPMTYLVCTQMRVVRDLTENPSSTIYLTTSNESQIFITGWHKGQPYTKDTKVKNFIQWTKTQSEADQMKKTVIGGYYPFPRPPNNFLKYCKNNKVESVLKAIGETGKEIEDLHYREHKRIAVQGIISAIRYISCSSVAEEASGMQLVQKDTSKILESSAMSKEDSVHKGKNTSLQTEEVKSSLGPHCPPGEQHQHQTVLSKKSSVKRKIPRRSNTNGEKGSASVTPVSSYPYFTRSARRKFGLTEFQHEEFVQDKNGQAVSDSVQYSTDGEGMNDIPETAETGRSCDSWQSDLWAHVKDKLTKYLHHSTIFAESIPRKFDYVHKDLLMQQYNLHAAVHQPKETRTDKNINEFKSASGLGYYEVTVLGINHDIAIDVAFLPLFCPEDPHLFQLEDIQNDTLLSCMSCISSCQQKATSNGRLCDMFPLSNEIVKAAMDLDGKHVVCILDICHLGDDKVEVFLSKIYKTVEQPGVDPVESSVI
ncbi:RPA-related protein RADX isoform X2 [Larus michahellis]|uniref:RPA-related protein RADX isoform X2 n=1 Tax=Larus michahellis TaxID=119627 RepID=UPI003D9BC42B